MLKDGNKIIAVNTTKARETAYSNYNYGLDFH